MQGVNDQENDVVENNNDIPKSTGVPKVPLDMQYDFTPQNPYSVQYDIPGIGQSEEINTPKPASGYWETFGAEAYDWNNTVQAGHWAYEKASMLSITEDPVSPGWSPKDMPEMFDDVDSQYYPYLSESPGPKALAARHAQALSEMHHDEVLANGSMWAKVPGGIVGAATDITNYVLALKGVKYAKYAPAILGSAGKALPGVAAYSVMSNAATQADRINGNVKDFALNSAVDTLFATSLFGVGGAIGLTVEKAHLWDLRKFAKVHFEGVDVNFKITDNAKLEGLVATGGEGVSADVVNKAQMLIDSSFSKQGLFKVPYLGDAVTKFLSMPILGSPLPRLLSSKYKTVSRMADLSVDHNIVTTELAEGGTSPQKFSSKMNQEISGLRALGIQMNALRLERNGLNIKNRPLGSVARGYQNVKNKVQKAFGNEDISFATEEKFNKEILTVLSTGENSEHPAINVAAKMAKDHFNGVYADYLKSKGYSEVFLPPRTGKEYAKRVYDTPYLNVNEDKWVKVVSEQATKDDAFIRQEMQPIRDLEESVKFASESHQDLIKTPGITNEEVGNSVRALEKKQRQLKSEKAKFQNKLRSDEKYERHIHDWHALSADEVKALKALTKKRDDLAKGIDEQKSIISDIKKNINFKTQKAKSTRDAKTAKATLSETNALKNILEQEESTLNDLTIEHTNEESILVEKAANGEIDKRFFNRNIKENTTVFKDPKERLRLRDEFSTHKEREDAALSAYNSIMNTRPEDLIRDVMGHISGPVKENSLKQRTLMVPDQLLIDNNFLSSDLMATLSNYTLFFSRRTHMNNVFGSEGIDESVESLISTALVEYNQFRAPLNKEKSRLEKQMTNVKEGSSEHKILKKKVKKVEKDIAKETKVFEKAKADMRHIHDKLMGKLNNNRTAKQIEKGIMGITYLSNLGFLPITMLNDITTSIQEGGVIPFIRDGIYPLMQSLGGVLKTKDSAAFRLTAPNVHLAIQDSALAFADRNWSMYTDPYFNRGKVVDTITGLAHLSSNLSLANLIDNHLQRIAGSLAQGEFMRILSSSLKGEISKKDHLFLRKYGIDPEKWAPTMVEAFEKHGGGKNSLGGYQSFFWEWSKEDKYIEASNLFGDAVFRFTKATNVNRGMLDSPFWADNIMGSLIHGFSGWMFASVQRLLIPTLQQPDGQRLAGFLLQMLTGSLVSPMRRLSRGEDWDDPNMTQAERAFEIAADAGILAHPMTVLADANLLLHPSFLKNMKNDKYRDRFRTGVLGPTFSTANKMIDIASMVGTGEVNKSDLKKLARFIPPANNWMFNHQVNEEIDKLNLPRTRAQARRQNQ